MLRVVSTKNARPLRYPSIRTKALSVILISATGNGTIDNSSRDTSKVHQSRRAGTGRTRSHRVCSQSSHRVDGNCRDRTVDSHR
jgi:hypothetical protein